MLSCDTCELAGIVGDDRFLDEKGVGDRECQARLKKRAERVKQNAKEAKGRYTEPKSGELR